MNKVRQVNLGNNVVKKQFKVLDLAMNVFKSALSYIHLTYVFHKGYFVLIMTRGLCYTYKY